jgi:hypothetical protein
MQKQAQADDLARSPPAKKGPAPMIRRLCLGFAVFLALVAPALAELAITGAPVTMRARPSGKAAAVQRIPQTAEIEVLKCARGWCRASWRRRYGYIPAEAVVLGPAPGDALPPPFVNGQPAQVTRPAWQWQGFYLGGNLGLGSVPW